LSGRVRHVIEPIHLLKTGLLPSRLHHNHI